MLSGTVVGTGVSGATERKYVAEPTDFLIRRRGRMQARESSGGEWHQRMRMSLQQMPEYDGDGEVAVRDFGV